MSVAATATRVKVDASGKKTEISTSKLKSVTSASKLEGKGKAVTTTTKATTTTATIKTKSAKKVYTLPGQKYDLPEEREPLRIFYESLSKQIPTSEMAEFWMMEHGMLSPDRAKKAYERKQRKQQQLRKGTPVKSQKINRPESSKSQLPKNSELKSKKRVRYSDSDDEVIIKHKKSKY
ncbi:uncharacterized protein LOC110026617 [Phalaenopsis equestris]|uniref:uncharacterized protein LOC110026617 n=1 Tax=Phalaenopsis equestris TaxID=78828 RepID=UPI0009E23E74|nr:uncharacterized protein LOC110026617 [Phalaenopsis equestris]